MHFVHYNTKYGDLNTAMDKPDGLAVLGFFFTLGRYNVHFQRVIEHFEDIKFKGKTVNISSIPLVEFIPGELNRYYRYEGSLTTPPCYESVIWTIFNDTTEIAMEQLEKFRTTIFENDETHNDVSYDVSDDFRPVQCMFHRKVYGSHSSMKYSTVGSKTPDTNGAASPSRMSAVALLVCLGLNLLNI